MIFALCNTVLLKEHFIFGRSLKLLAVFNKNQVRSAIRGEQKVRGLRYLTVSETS